MSILEEIFDHKRIEVAESRVQISEKELEAEVERVSIQANLRTALRSEAHSGIRLIAEIKAKSPSKGVLIEDFDPQFLAKIYTKNGATAISVLTDEKYFNGSLDTLKSIHTMSLGLPLLRKDFIFDRYQLLETRVSGASAALLIVAMLDDNKLEYLVSECKKLSLTALVEVHNENELERALEANAEVIGINNRNLHDFSVDLETSFQLARLCPPEIVIVAESGINSNGDIQRLAEARIDAVLVGEALVTAPDIASKVRSLAGMKTT
jgi:indole-3-glycerol phosphate synthase